MISTFLISVALIKDKPQQLLDGVLYIIMKILEF